MIVGALYGVGGQEYLEEQARASPTAFLKLVGQIVPRDVTVDAAVQVAGEVALYLPDNGRDKP